MSKSILVVVLSAVLLLACVGGAVALGELWTATYNGSVVSDDKVAGSVRDCDGNIIVTGTSGGRFLTFKYSSTGSLIWEARCDRGTTNDDTASAVTTDSSGNVYVTGYGGGNFITVKYDSAGHQEWVQTLYGSAYARAIVVDSDGNVYVVGETYRNYGLVKYDSSGNQLWYKQYTGPKYDYPKAAAVDKAGTIYITGQSQNSTGLTDIATVAFDSAGNQVWARVYNSPGSGNDVGNAIAVDSDGNIIVTGTSYTNAYKDFTTIKYSPTGQQLWIQNYDGPKKYDDVATAIALDSANNIYVAGNSWGTWSAEFTVVKYDSSGSQTWASRYSTTAGSVAFPASVAVDESGNSYVSGYIQGGSQDFLTIKFDAAGNQTWAEMYNGPVNYGNDYAAAVSVDAGGNVCVAGTSSGVGTGADYMTIGYNPDGTDAWTQRYASPPSGRDMLASMVAGPNGDLYVTGASERSSGVSDFVTAKYNSSGNQQWLQRYTATETCVPASVALDSSGCVYTTGACSLRSDYLTIKYSASGAQSWTATYSTTDSDYPVAVATDSSGNVYVTGESYTPSVSLYDVVTVKYDAAGNKLWQASYNGPASKADTPNSVVVDAAGSIYIAGTCTGTATGQDCLLLKYDSSGIQQWARTYAGYSTSDDQFTAVAVDGAGNIIVTGRCRISFSAQSDVITAKYDPAGNLLWMRIYDTPERWHEVGSSVAVDASGNVFVTGTSQTTEAWPVARVLTFKYDPDGNLLWVRTYDDPERMSDTARTIALDAAGNTCIVGTSMFADALSDALTLKYSPMGELMWAKNFDGMGHGSDSLASVCFDPSGNVCVAGTTNGGATNSDYLLIKYDGVAPTGTVVINDGAESTTTMGVTLALSAADEATGVAQMRFSNDGTNWSGWESYAATKAWTLAAPDGLKTVYVQFRDGMGNFSTAVTDTITMTATPPEFVSVSVSPAMAASGDSLHVSVSASDAVHGVASVAADGVALANTSGSIWEGDITAQAALGVHSVTIGAVDGLGNVTSGTASYRTAGILGIAGDCLPDPIMAAASSQWLFKLWGRVKIIDDSHIDIDYGAIREDESIPLLHVFSPGYSGITDDDYVWVRGVLDPATATITARPEHVVKQNNEVALRRCRDSRLRGLSATMAGTETGSRSIPRDAAAAVSTACGSARGHYGRALTPTLSQ